MKSLAFGVVGAVSCASCFALEGGLGLQGVNANLLSAAILLSAWGDWLYRPNPTAFVHVLRQKQNGPSC